MSFSELEVFITTAVLLPVMSLFLIHLFRGSERGGFDERAPLRSPEPDWWSGGEFDGGPLDG